MSFKRFNQAYEQPIDPLSYSKISAMMTEDVCKTLDKQQYIVIDNALGAGLCSALRQEIMWLYQAGFMSNNNTAYVVSKDEKDNPSAQDSSSSDEESSEEEEVDTYMTFL